MGDELLSRRKDARHRVHRLWLRQVIEFRSLARLLLLRDPIGNFLLLAGGEILKANADLFLGGALPDNFPDQIHVQPGTTEAHIQDRVFLGVQFPRSLTRYSINPEVDDDATVVGAEVDINDGGCSMPWVTAALIRTRCNLRGSDWVHKNPRRVNRGRR